MSLRGRGGSSSIILPPDLLKDVSVERLEELANKEEEFLTFFAQLDLDQVSGTFPEFPSVLSLRQRRYRGREMKLQMLIVSFLSLLLTADLYLNKRRVNC